MSHAKYASITACRGKPSPSNWAVEHGVSHSANQTPSSAAAAREESKATYPFDRGALLLRDLHDVRPGRELPALLASALRLERAVQEVREHLRVLAEQLRERRIRRGELLDDGLRELGVLRHGVAQVLQLRVLRERTQVARAPCTEARNACTGAGLLCLLPLLGELEEVLALGGLGRWRRLSGGGGGSGRLGLGLGLSLGSRWRLGRGSRSLSHMFEVSGDALHFPRNLSAQDTCGRCETT